MITFSNFETTGPATTGSGSDELRKNKKIISTVLIALVIVLIAIKLDEARDEYNRNVQRDIAPLVVEVFGKKSYNCPMKRGDSFTIHERQLGCPKVCILAKKATRLRTLIKEENRRLFWGPGLGATIFDYSRQFAFGKPRLHQKGCSELLWGASRTNKGVSGILGMLPYICLGYFLFGFIYLYFKFKIFLVQDQRN
tara:strand:- start:282 stop:869 length:588 start_codon:yes stop_codon:yes gene_type:complete